MRNKFLLLFFFSIFLHAQNETHTHHSKDSIQHADFDLIILNNKKIPIPNASVYNLTTQEHSHSAPNGSFLFLHKHIGDRIEVFADGYKSITVTLSDQTKEIVLEEDDVANKIFLKIKPNKQNPIASIAEIDLIKNPVNSSQEILRRVPGLVIGQHAGGGKAEQIFLRGYDIDHGTDLRIDVDGMPVNMVSHAHGQGYSDLHFLIPETVEKIEFGKGPYNTSKGDFQTAGYVSFKTKDFVESNLLSVDVGQFNTKRVVGLFDLLKKADKKAYFATEYSLTDGPFVSSQNFNRLNLFTKYSESTKRNEEYTITGSYFKSSWDASGQVPQSAIDNGLISRFGAIDDTEGGNTSRANLLLDYNKKISNKSSLSSKVFYNYYDFELFSNFTFFLEDPINGDQIKQKEKRAIFGFQTKYDQKIASSFADLDWSVGFGVRSDQILGNELSRTKNRTQLLERLSLGDINQNNYSVFSDIKAQKDKWFFNLGLRADYFRFQYEDQLTPEYNNQSMEDFILSPKLSLSYDLTNDAQIYLKSGIGFHSNDTRVVVQQQARETLPAVYGLDLGYFLVKNDNFLLNAALWYLHSEQEFVYVGDAAIVEPSGRSRRQGVDVNFRYQPYNWLSTNADFTYTHARAIDEPDGSDFIPLAVNLVTNFGVQLNAKKGFYFGLDTRMIDDRPANEDNSIVAPGYTIFDASIGFKTDRFNINLLAQNLFDVEWNETQFATESRLFNEINPVEEIHLTPGTPFFLRLRLEYKF